MTWSIFSDSIIMRVKSTPCNACSRRSIGINVEIRTREESFYYYFFPDFTFIYQSASCCYGSLLMLKRCDKTWNYIYSMLVKLFFSLITGKDGDLFFFFFLNLKSRNHDGGIGINKVQLIRFLYINIVEYTIKDCFFF